MSWYRLLRLAHRTVVSMPLVDNHTSINYMDIGHRSWNGADEFEGRDVAWWIDENWQFYQETPNGDDSHHTLFPEYSNDYDDVQRGIAKGRYSYGPDAPSGQCSVVLLNKYRRPETRQNVAARVVRILEQAFGPETEVMLF